MMLVPALLTIKVVDKYHSYFKEVGKMGLRYSTDIRGLEEDKKAK